MSLIYWQRAGVQVVFLNYLFLATLVNNANEKTLTPL